MKVPQAVLSLPRKSASVEPSSNLPRRNGQGNEGHEGDEEEGSHEGHEGDEEEGSHEGHEGHEEEDREQDRQGPDGQGHGAPREQGEDCWWLDCKGLDQEQVWQDRQQEEQCEGKEVPMDAGLCQGAEGLEAHGLCRDQEGLPLVREGEGVLRQLSAMLIEK